MLLGKLFGSMFGRRAASRDAPAAVERAVALLRQGRAGEAEVLLGEALASAPGDAQLRQLLASIALARGRPGQALDHLAAIVSAPGPETGFMRAEALARLGRIEEALAAHRELRSRFPDFAAGHAAHGTLLSRLGHWDEAVEALREAARLDPASTKVLNNLGNALKEIGDVGEALRCFEAVIGRAPDFPDAHSSLIFLMDIDAGSTVQSAQAERRRWAARFADPLWRDVVFANDRDPDRRLRIGYVSGDFREHSAARTFGVMLFGHDRTQFEVFAYHNSTHAPDAYTERFRQAVDHWHDVSALGDADVAERMRADAIDVAVDLSGHTSGNRLLALARRPAPVQVSAWGYVTGTGMRAMQYLLADPVIVPHDERHLYAEEVVDLPVYTCLLAGAPWPDAGERPAPTAGCIRFGSLNRMPKMTPETYDLWSRVLRAVPESRMVIKTVELTDLRTRERVLERFEHLGVDRDRLLLAGRTPWQEHMAAYRDIDVCLDPFPHTGGTTTMEALMMGVPVLTVRHATPAGRSSAAVLTALGLDDWIARDRDDFVRIAAVKASDADALATLRRGLRNRFLASPVGDNAAYCRAAEAAYRRLWRRWCAAP